MRYKVLLLLLVVTLLGITACDRFTKPEKLDVDTLDAVRVANIFNEDITTAINTISQSDVGAIINSYSLDYLNDGMSKTDMEAKFEALAENKTKGLFTVDYEILDAEKARVQWVIKDELDDIVFFDIDIMAITEDNFLFLGNKMGALSEGSSVAFIEVLTAKWCPNCPELEEKVDELQEHYGNNVQFVEYHYDDGLSGDFTDIQNWYNIFSAPTGVVQGTTILVGSETSTLNQYDGLILETLDNEPDISITNFEFVRSVNHFHFHMNLTNQGSIPMDNLNFRYMFVEDTSSELNNAGKPCRNVMLEQAKYELSEEDFTGVFSVEYTTSIDLPLDTKVIAFVQTMPEPHSAETAKIYGVASSFINK